MKKPKESHKYFYLAPKEEAAMKVLWNTDDALSASEIAEAIPDRTWPASSIQSILRSLERKNAVRVDSIAKLGKSYGRLFRPALSANEYAAMQFGRYYQSGKDGKTECFSMMSSLLGNISIEKENVIEALQDLIREYEKKEH